jgi:hypothetical protein
MILIAGITTALLAAGCMGGPEDASSSDMALSVFPGAPDLPMCHWVPALVRGKEVTLWPLKYYDDLLAVDFEGEVVCIETTTAALELGMTAVPSDQQPDYCRGAGSPVCDGTPMPANQFNAAARSHSIDHSEI